MQGVSFLRKIVFPLLILFLVLLSDCSPGKRMEKIVLPNGLRIILLHRDSPVSSAVFLIRCGEADGPEGLTRITTDLLLRGTEIRTSHQMYEEIESLGGRVGDETALMTSLVYVQAPPETFQRCFNILGECLTQPAFDNEWIEKMYHKTRSQFTFIGEHYLWKDSGIRQILFCGSPLSRSLYNNRKRIYPREEILNHYRKYYIPSNIVLAVVGRFGSNEILKEVLSLWPPLKQNRGFRRPDVSLGVLEDTREKISLCKKSSTDRVLIGFSAPASFKNSFLSVRLLEMLIASGKSSFLPNIFQFEGKREYKIKSYYQSEEAYGYFVIEIETPSGEGFAAKSFVLNKLEQLKKNGISLEQFEIAKRKLLFELAYNSQYTLQEAVFLATAFLGKTSYLTLPSIEEEIKKINLDEVQHTANSLFQEPAVWISTGILKR